MSTRSLLTALIAVALTVVFGACSEDHGNKRYEFLNPNLTVKDINTGDVLMVMKIETFFDSSSGRYKYRVVIPSGPNKGKVIEGETEDYLRSKILEAMSGEKWDDGSDITQDDLDTIDYLIKTYWTNPGPSNP